MERSLVCLVFLLALAHQGLCLIAVTDPERDMIVAGSEGDGGIVFNCSIYDDLTLQNRRITQFSLTEDPNAMPLMAVPLNPLFPDFDTTFNITGDPSNIPSPPTFSNVLTILNFTADLDGQTLFCGTGGSGPGEPFLAGFPLRLYRPPVLTTDGTFTIIEGLFDTFSVEDSTAPPAFPTPTIFWFRNGESVANVSTVGFTYPQVSFAPVNRGDSGTYTLRAFNTRLNSSEVVGNATGSFELDVLFGPDVDGMVQLRHVVLEGLDLNVSCATNLQSNPAATVVWLDNNGVEIMNTLRYTLNNAEGSVSLNITPTQGRDNGQWSCTLNVTGPPDTIGGAEVGVLTRTFDIVVVVPPNPPELVTVIEDNSTATSLFVCWQGSPPTNFTPVSQYEVNVTADDDNTVRTERTTSNQTSLLVDGLLPGTAYSIQVVAIAAVDDVEGQSTPSNIHQTNTSTTVPAPVCEPVVSDRGNIIVTWNFTHTGGLDLTNLTVNYTFMEGEVINNVPVPVSLEQMSATVGGLEVARRYTFTIIGSNELGPGEVVCSEFLHSIGIPQAPKTPLISQSGARDVRINLTTVAAGVGASPHSFRFNVRVTNIDNMQLNDIETFQVDDYASGEYRDFLITDLTVGEAYTFSAQSANDFGSSRFIPADGVITISGVTATTPTGLIPTGSPQQNVGAIVGGVIGGIIAVILLVLIVLAVIFIVFKLKGTRSYEIKKGRTNNNGAAEASSGVRVQDIDLGQELTQHPAATGGGGGGGGGGGEEGGAADSEIHYADLATFNRPESAPKNRPIDRPSEPEEPVEYATITSFPSKKQEEGTPAEEEKEKDAIDKSQTSTTLV